MSATWGAPAAASGTLAIMGLGGQARRLTLVSSNLLAPSAKGSQGFNGGGVSGKGLNGQDRQSVIMNSGGKGAEKFFEH